MRRSVLLRTFWRILLHFDEVGPAQVVEPPAGAIAEEGHLQLPLQVRLQVAQLQRTDAVGSVYEQALLVVRTVRHLPEEEEEEE